ncbi:hypothetical protein [Streptomyces sp. CBMA152]|uniref:hypothetical protein n=1 Tax=Streptomyces sp. CBMA152 TaxID=1896312 RepID=UPI0016614FD9|nr:hypothetical protein [Streptomyces sp. CBMA152]MBD0746035.1 hypothetical protein [Streptomyces sp. CBMA152]
MYERHRSAEPALPPAPRGTRAVLRSPSGVKIGDYVCRDGLFLQVADMRSAGTATQRVLLFDGHAPWLMTAPTITYRPIELA